MFSPDGRRQGVQVPDTQTSPRGEAPPNTVLNVVPCQMLAVEFSDDQGAKHSTVVLEMAGKIYNPPNSEEWARALRGTQKWFQEGVAAKLPRRDLKAEVPVQDNVEVMAAQRVADEVPTPSE